jgi:NHL repeat
MRSRVVMLALAPLLVLAQLGGAEPAGATAGAAPSGLAAPGPYTAVRPFRICDTRPIGHGIVANQCDHGTEPLGPLTQRQTRAVTVGGGSSGVPGTGVSAVVVNVTAINPSLATYLTLFPAGGSPPKTSNINPAAGAVVANLVEVGVSAGGQISVYNNAGTINIALDVEGYVSAGATGTAGLFNPTTPTRICDTRIGAGITRNQCDLPGAQPVTPTSPLTFNISASGSPVPPTGVSAVEFNLTAIAPTSATVLTAYAGGSVRPTASNLNLTAGSVVPNRVIVPVPAHCVAPGCTVTIWNGVGSVNVAVDIDGWFTDAEGIQTTGSLFSGVAPSRLCDTRSGSADAGCAHAKIGAGGTLHIAVAGEAGIPSMSSGTPPVAVVANVTALTATTSTFVTAYSPDDSSRPGVSDLNVLAGKVDTNLVAVQVGSDGAINLYNGAGSVNLIVDVLGYYTLGAGGSAPTYQGDLFNAGGIAPMYPAGGGADASGTMYLADSGGSRIDRIDSGGNLTYITPSSGPPLSNPRSLSLDVTTPSDLWVTDTGANALVEMTTAGTVLETFSASSSPALSLTSPFGNDNDSSGVYVADTYASRIIKVNKTTGAITWSQTTCGTAMSRPRDVAVGSDGNIYAVDTDNNRVVELNATTGACITSWTGGSQALHQPRAITSDGAGGLWIAEDGANPAITHYTDAGVFIGKTLNTGAGGFIEPEGVFTDGSSIVAADPFANQVVTFTVSAGVPSATGVAINKGAAVLGGFNNPFGVAYAPNGDCYVTDMFNQRIEKFTGCTGTPITTGNFGGGPGQMQNPRGISVSPDGSTVILTNSEDERIDFFSSSLVYESSISPVLSTCASKNLFFPHQVAYDATNNSYWVADTNNNRIVDLSAASATLGHCLANWTGTGATIAAPRGIVWDGSDLWVANAQTGQILRCTTAGVCTAVAARTGTLTIVNSPWNLTIVNGTLYIADEGAGSIVVMNMTAPYATVYTFGTLGSNPSLGQLGSPRSVSVNPLTGEVAVADFDNDDISFWR